MARILHDPLDWRVVFNRPDQYVALELGAVTLRSHEALRVELPPAEARRVAEELLRAAANCEHPLTHDCERCGAPTVDAYALCLRCARRDVLDALGEDSK